MSEWRNIRVERFMNVSLNQNQSNLISLSEERKIPLRVGKRRENAGDRLVIGQFCI